MPLPRWDEDEICALCCRSAGDFYLFPGRDGLPEYRACSAACIDAIAALSADTGTMLMKTQMEAEAIFQARRPLYEKLVEYGFVDIARLAGVHDPVGGLVIKLADIFGSLTAQQIDGIIEVVWDAVRASMQLQSAQGEMPVQQPDRTIPFAASPLAQSADHHAAGGLGSEIVGSEHPAPHDAAQTAGEAPPNSVRPPTSPAGVSVPFGGPPAGTVAPPSWQPPRSAEMPNDRVDDLWPGVTDD